MSEACTRSRPRAARALDQVRRGLCLVWWASLALALALSAPAAAQGDDPEPMFGQRDGVWGRLLLQYRARPELRSNADLDASADDNVVFGLQRARLGLALNHADWLEGFVQLQDARAAGMGNSSVAYAGNTDLHQAWARWTLRAVDLSLKIGRQQLVYGDQRLIGHLEWANQGRVFEAAVVRWQHPLGWLDAFASAFTPRPNGDMLNATHFFGLYDAVQLLEGSVVIEQYLLGLVDAGEALPAGQLFDPSLAAQPAGPERQLLTLGSRVRYSQLGVDGGLECAYQLGTAHVGKKLGQSAYALHGDLRYTFPVRMSPFVYVEGNLGSGDDRATTRVSERFVNLFPTNHAHYGAMDLQSWSNALDGAVGGGFNLWQGLSMKFDYWLHGRASAHDAWLDAGGMALATPDPAKPTPYDDELLLGHEFNSTVKWVANTHLALVGGAGLFLPAGYAQVLGTDPQLWGFGMLVASL